MASFANIRAAIVEKGGTVTGGYADYAKNIRNLYSNDTYTSQYQYPTEKSCPKSPPAAHDRKSLPFAG